MEKMLKGTRNINLENDGTFLLDYYLIQSKIEDSIDVFGIEVVKKMEDRIEEISSIPYITEDKEEIQTIMDKMIGGYVTPYTLGEIIDELIS